MESPQAAVRAAIVSDHEYEGLLCQLKTDVQRRDSEFKRRWSMVKTPRQDVA